MESVGWVRRVGPSGESDTEQRAAIKRAAAHRGAAGPPAAGLDVPAGDPHRGASASALALARGVGVRGKGGIVGHAAADTSAHSFVAQSDVHPPAVCRLPSCRRARLVRARRPRHAVHATGRLRHEAVLLRLLQLTALELNSSQQPLLLATAEQRERLLGVFARAKEAAAAAKPRILLTGPTNASVDGLLERVLRGFFGPTAFCTGRTSCAWAATRRCRRAATRRAH